MLTNTHRVDIEDVQAMVCGFGRTWTWGRFYYVGIASDLDNETTALVRSCLSSIPAITSYADLESSRPELALNIAVTYTGLCRLRTKQSILDSFPAEFRVGMCARAESNGDTGDSSPSNWAPYWQTASVDLVVAIYAKSESALEKGDAQLREVLLKNDNLDILDTQDVHRFVQSDDLVEMHIEKSDSRAKPGNVLEHFGFRDGLSQPAYAGLDTKHVKGGGKFSTQFGWSPISTGELLLGYPYEAGELSMHPRPAEVARNGTFLVLRKLRQNVDVFRKYLTDFSSLSPESDADTLAAQMVGRHRDGRSLLDDVEENAINDFTYVSDPSGQQCPLGAHARRANPRNTMGEDTLLVNRHRLLRRAITYGKPVPHGVSETDVNGSEGQGLIFIALNADIERQFEFVQQQWINFGNDLGQGNDRDHLIGSNQGRGQFVVPGNSTKRTALCTALPDFVTTEGGDYFFLPGISAWKQLLSN